MTPRTWVAFLVGIFTAALVGAGGLAIWRAQKMTKIHTLVAPLLIAAQDSSKNLHLLPKGTTLYFDRAFSEGFTSYKVYVNVDRMPLQLEELADPTEVRPIEAFAPTAADLRKLLKDYPLTRDDLVSILKSTKLDKQELRSILAEYSQ